ncbi:Flavocytochrome c [Tilletiaria anomala UBC 951]|uniref:fumarate reductase (NADH) n=1 Tax=Tilletiaria anomala (strain ATCC 24038 / CBS 436.72 / UBC 951) TaxID=1037660 RepID=A0A066WEC9_TILAU|nr:Flavocytochrome c [Tilletiaria anomala UBC 951]KDN50868.1 Flavocytochrome c [Tilletiaria anomala UBC 951]
MSKVIVVGGGLSGLSAAHTLIDRGANVVVLDKNGYFGGNSTKATSGINGAGTTTQANLDIRDTAKTFFEDTKKSAADLARDDLIKVLTYKSGDAVTWLQDKFGLALDKISRLGGHSEMRTHRSGAGGKFPGMEITMALMDLAEDEAKNRPDRFQIIRKADVKHLIYENGIVKGVEYELNGQRHQEYGPVILATGGYAADFSDSGSLLKEFKPEYFNLPTTNGAHCTGDGQKMVRAIDGSLIDMEKVQVHPTGLVDPKDPDAKVKFLAAEALRGCGGLLVDNEGQRFIDELEKRAVVTAAMWKHDKFPVRLILNGEASREIEWHCKHYQGRGLMKRFETVEEVAKDMGIDASKLKSTFDDYIQIGSGKKKDPFGKRFHHNWNMKEGPYYVALMTPVLHYTMGGVEINDQAQILSKSGKPIPGLYACGELAGGVHGANRLGGSSLLGCVVYGRVAGDAASAYLLEGISTGKIAAGRAAQIQQQLETRVRVNPETSSVNVSFHWAPEAGVLSSSGSSGVAQTAPAAQSNSSSASSGSEQPAQQELKEYTLDDVAKHNKDDDVWVVVNGKVLDVTKFLPDHPGGEKAILLYKGKDCSEEFEMMHDESVIAKYAPYVHIGNLKQ